jgi:hypothetical protein
MKMKPIPLLAFSLLALSACVLETPITGALNTDACGASQFQSMVGGPSSAAMALDIPGDSRHYGRAERTAINDPSRLNFVHSGTAIESVTDPNATIVRVFCG